LQCVRNAFKVASQALPWPVAAQVTNEMSAIIEDANHTVDLIHRIGLRGSFKFFYGQWQGRRERFLTMGLVLPSELRRELAGFPCRCRNKKIAPVGSRLQVFGCSNNAGELAIRLHDMPQNHHRMAPIMTRLLLVIVDQLANLSSKLATDDLSPDDLFTRIRSTSGMQTRDGSLEGEARQKRYHQREFDQEPMWSFAVLWLPGSVGVQDKPSEDECKSNLRIEQERRADQR
ncbi:hypothetical protein KCU76_g26, partial [Aureobasidium melanogenum]